MIINDSIKINEVKSIDLGNDATAYQSAGKYYIKKGDTKKEISADQYAKLQNKDKELATKNKLGTSSKASKVKSSPKSKINDILNDKNSSAGDKFYKIINDKGTRNYLNNNYGQYFDYGIDRVFRSFDNKSSEEINNIIDNSKDTYFKDTLVNLSKFINRK